jgi:hypothetical protein
MTTSGDFHMALDSLTGVDVAQREFLTSDSPGSCAGA